MQHNEARLRVAGKYSVPRRDQLRIARKAMSVKRLVRMVAELFVSLVEPVSRREEGNWIGDVNRHGHVQLRARVPHGVESRIVDLDQRSGRDVVSQVESECLQNFESAGAVTMSLFDGLGL